MKLLVLIGAVLAAASALSVKDEHMDYFIGKDNMVMIDVKMKEFCVMKLLNHILQPTMYPDIRDVAREWIIEDNFDKYLKMDVVKTFLQYYKMGMLPRGEIFVHTNEFHLSQAVRVFRLLYFCKDFDVFIRTACWLRERINGGMFVYAFTAAVFHRDDCRGIILPAPYEIYPYFFVDSHVINKAYMMKMMKTVEDAGLMDYYGIRMTEKNTVIIDARKDLRHVMSMDDKISYFTEDIDLNTYMYYMHMNYPYWMNDEVYGLHKERFGEVSMYFYQQLLARYRLERLSHNMCDINMLMWDDKTVHGYWPKIRMHNGEEMPMRANYVDLVNEFNLKDKLLMDDMEKIIREAILTGHFKRRDGTMFTLKKAEDYEYLARMILGGYGFVHDDAKTIHVLNLFKRILGYLPYNFNKYTYVPTALDMYTTCLRDPIFWRVMKRLFHMGMLFKTLLPKYTHEEYDFPGVKVEKFYTDKLVTFMDEYDMDITNAMYLDKMEMQKMKPDMMFVARTRRLNHHPFKVSIDVVSDKAVDAVVRIFIGPKYDCMGRLMSVNDKRLDMVEMDSFLYKLETGKNTIVRNSLEMHGVIEDRPWTRNYFNHGVDTSGTYMHSFVESWWYKSRLGFPHRLLLPLGHLGGFPMQMYVIVTPVRTGLVLPTVDMSVMKMRHVCYWTTCVDTMPLGFPFDREIDMTYFFTNNMKFMDVMIYRKDLDMTNVSKDVDMSDMIMKRDDLTYLDRDCMVHRSYRDMMMMGTDRMMRM